MSIHRPVTKEEFNHPIMSHVVPIFAFKKQQCLVGGTAVLIAPHFAFTAKHVLEYLLSEFGYDIRKKVNVALDIYLHQISTGCIWYVSQTFAWIGTDIVLLRLHPRTDNAKTYNIDRIPMTVDPPDLGSEITGLGYPATKMELRRNDNEVTDIKLEITPTVSTGRVTDIHRSMRDSSMLDFPCFSVGAQFSSGMSGGAVFNNKKELCGLVCSGSDVGDGQDEPYANAVSIWPSMIISLTLNPGGLTPNGLEIGQSYKILDLARLGYLDFKGHERIEFFKHENASDGVRRKHYKID